jgi:predicted dehydrogenase
MKSILVIGYGSIGQRHIANICKLYPAMRIICLRHKPDCHLAEKHEYAGVAKVVYGLTDALAEQPEAAIIANPAPYHLKIAKKLAENGIHLLIEKPLADRSDEVDSLLNICKSQSLCLMVGYNLRFIDSLRRLKSMIEKSQIGKILSVHCEVGQYLPSWRSGSDYRTTVTAQRKLGGGVLLELSHEIDYLLWLFGDMAETSGWAGRRSDLEIDVEDTAHAIFGFVREGESEMLHVSLHMDCVRHDTSRNCVVIGEKGTLRWDGVRGRLESFLSHDPHWRVESEDDKDRNNSYLLELKHFVDCVNRRSTPVDGASGEDGKKVLQVIEAIQRSISMKRTELIAQ